MRHHVKKLILLLIIFLTYTGCDFGNNSNDIYLSKNRTADITLLEIEIKKIDSKITQLNIQNRELDSSSLLSQKEISRNQEEISKLESERDILEKKIMKLYEMEQE